MADQFGLPSYTPTSSYGSTWGTGNGLAAAAGSGSGNMWIMAAGSVLGSIASSGAAKKQAKTDFKNQQKLNEQGGVLSRQNSQFDMALAHYYSQMEKGEKMRGLDEFRKFSTVSNYAPNYQNTNPGPVIPQAPVYNQGAYAPAKV